MTGAAHIAVVDDDEDVRGAVAEYLRRNGHAVSECDGAEQLREVMASRPVDLAILDITMPGEDGLTIAREIRALGRAGIIMLTARNEDVDKIVGLEVGADDYVTKPYNSRELLARVKAVLRRVQQPEAPAATLGPEVRMGKCRLNLATHRLYDPDGAEVKLTSMEYDLLRTFAENPNRVLSRDQLLELAHDKGMEAFDRSIDTRIARIRRKIEPDPARPDCLRTVRGAGYLYNPACRTA